MPLLVSRYHDKKSNRTSMYYYNTTYLFCCFSYQVLCVTVCWAFSLFLWLSMLSVVLQAELDRFCNAMIAIREEIRDIENGKADK